MKKSLPLIVSSLILAGCTSYTQTTSGESYLEKYKTRHTASSESSDKTFDQKIRMAAAVEPMLRFPARIGIARIEHGRLSAVPGQEMESWQKMKKNLSREIGELVPVSPMIAKMVAAQTGSDASDRQENAINEIRLGAARQHLDAVLIYEVYSKEESESNFLSIADLTIIGAYIIPSRAVNAEGFANAMLIDVIQGYPYGTVDVTVDKEEVYTPTFGSNNTMRELADSVKTKATVKLSKEVEEMFHNLKRDLKAKKSS